MEITLQANLPTLLTFVFATILTVWFFVKAAKPNLIFVIALAFWMVFYALLAMGGFFTNLATTPPRFPLLILPALLVMVATFITKSGKKFIDGLDIKILVILSIIRIPIEIALFQLYHSGLVPVEMTFEGRNFDILSGISAPFIAFLCFGKTTSALSRKLLLGWNILALALLINIVVTAILAAPTPLQQIAFEQPNVAVLRFPFVWLPSLVVPIVLFSHLAIFRWLFMQKTTL